MKEDISSLEEAYKELELKPGASSDDVRKAFRKLAAKHHPDKHKDNPDAEKKFKRINRAKQIIDNPQKELRGSSSFGDDIGFDPVEIFRNMRRSGPKRKPNPVIDVHLTFKESIDGVKKNISYKRFEKCHSCNGNGGVKTSNNCQTCSGVGVFSRKQGNVVMQTQCPACNGTGKEIENCSSCNGDGVVEKDVSTTMELPFGLRDGQTIGASGGGNFVGVQQNPFFGSVTDAYGDAILRIHVEKDPDMRLDPSGKHVESDISLTLLEALEGKNVKVRTLKGDLTLKVKAGAKNGQQIVAKGYGSGGMGNHIFNVSVEYPENVDKLINYLKNEE